MGKFVGLMGALTTIGAVAYLMAPLPPSATTSSDGPAPSAATPGDVQSRKVSDASSRRRSTADPASRSAPATSTPRGEPEVVLIRQIQAELHRLGCYDGAINGLWSAATQRAMHGLGERVSVLRPVDTPDYIMLALARSQSSTVCASTHRTASTPPRSRLTEMASREIAHQGEGQVRPTSGTTRVATGEPDRLSPPETQRRWRAVVDAPKRSAVRSTDPNTEAARLKAARDELDRIETRTQVATNLTPDTRALVPEQSPSSGTTPSDGTRMGLGIGPGDPLQAHADPRNPTEPAMLRGPQQPAPQLAADNRTPPSANEPAQQPAPAASPTPTHLTLPPERVFRKQSKREWMRSVFTDMRFNGP